MSTGIAPSTTEDALLGGAVMLRQPARGYRVTSDSVLLAALTPLAENDSVLELGTGYGQVLLCLLARYPQIKATGIELMPAALDLARQNAVLNHYEERLTLEQGDIASYPFTPLFNAVVTNPPYRSNSHTPSPDPVKAAATVEQIPLSHWVEAAAKALKVGGHLLMIQDARREAEISRALEAYGFGRSAILPLLSKAEGGDITRIVARAQFGGRYELQTLPPLVMHESDGSWRSEIAAALRGPKPLAPWPF